MVGLAISVIGIDPSSGVYRFTFGSPWRGSLIGSFGGIVPGAGGTVASALAYTTEKRVVERRDLEGSRLGRGDMRGLASVEAADNSASNNNFIPMLTLGIPVRVRRRSCWGC
jgi:putative tricarboxylic transport membrane protein